MANKTGMQKKTRVLGPMQHLSLHTLFQHAHMTKEFHIRFHLAPELNQNNQHTNNKLSLFFEWEWG